MNLVAGRDGVVEELLKYLVVLDGYVLGVVVVVVVVLVVEMFTVGAFVGGVFLMLSFRPKKLEKS